MYTKMKNLFSKGGAFLQCEFLEKVVLVGCNMFFILVLKIWRNSLKKTPCRTLRGEIGSMETQVTK